MTASPLRTRRAPTSSRYEVLGHLARGGMGEILLARRIGPAGFEKLVVLKRPLAIATGSHMLVDALIAEARLLAQINHPNVCQIHDLEEADGEYFLALELLEGLPLWTMLVEAEGRARPIDPRVVCGVFEQVCDGLDAIHRLRTRDGAPAGIVHRDISPGNLFVTDTGTVKILDLGIAKSADSEERTPHGNVKGKLPYLAPEQVAAKPLDGRADLFALGLVLYDVARNRRPPIDRVGAMAYADLELDGVPAPLAQVIVRAVQPDRERRFGSARELAAAIRAASTALGGAFGRGELAEYLAHEFAAALAERRAHMQATIAGHAPRQTRTLTLRTVLGTDSGIEGGETERGAGSDVLGSADAGSWVPPADDRARSTEPLTAEPRPGRGAHASGGRTTDRPLIRATERLAAEPRPRRGAHASRGRTMDRPLIRATERLGAEADRPRGERIARTQPVVAPPAKRRVWWVIAIGGAIAIAGVIAMVTAAEPVHMAPAASESVGAAVSPPRAEGSAVKPPVVVVEPSAPATPPPEPAPEPQQSIERPPVRKAVPAARGLVTIGSMPWADVWIGTRKLRTDVWRLELPVGRHTLRARTEDGRAQQRTFRVEPGKETRIVLDWSDS